MSITTMGVNDVAAILMVHANRVLELAASNELSSVKIGRKWVFREEDVKQFLDRKIRERKMGKGW